VSPPVVTTQAVYMVEYQLLSPGTSSVSALALGVGDGKVLWRRSYGTTLDARITLVANGSAAGFVIKQVPSGPAADPFVSIASVQALDVEGEDVLWVAEMPPDMTQIRVLRVGDTLYLNGQYLLDQNQSLLVALQASNGHRLWVRQHSYDQITLLGGQDLYGYAEYGYASSATWQGKKHLCWLDVATGQDRWCVESLRPNLFSLSATPDMVIVGEVLQPDPLTLIHNLYGLSKQDGQMVWKLPWMSSSPSVQTLTLVTVVENQDFQVFTNM
jgi:hypothetical protein